MTTAEAARELRVLAHKARTEGRFSHAKNTIEVPAFDIIRIHELAAIVDEALQRRPYE